MVTTLLAALSYSYTYGPTTNTTTTTTNIPAGVLLAIYAAVFVVSIFLFIIPLWKIFKKFNRPGWAAIVPFYNSWVIFEIVGYPGWWALLSIIPIVNFFPMIMLLIAYFKLAKLFGKSDGFAICTVLFSFVCIPILGYGKAQPVNIPGGVPTPPAGGYNPPVPPQHPVPPSAPNPNMYTPPTPPSAPVAPGEPPAAPTPPVDPNTPSTPPAAPTSTDNSNPTSGY